MKSKIESIVYPREGRQPQRPEDQETVAQKESTVKGEAIILASAGLQRGSRCTRELWSTEIMGHIESKNKGLLAGKLRNCVTGRAPSLAQIINKKQVSPGPLRRSKKKTGKKKMDPKRYGNAS